VSALVRSATLKDAALLASLHRACFDEAWDEEAFRRLLDRAGAVALLASLEGETESQAFLLAQVAADECEILSIGSLGAVRRRGLARTLLTAAGGRAHGLGAREIFLEVAEDNSAALALYRAAGFVIIGRRAKYYRRANGTALDAVMLRATLPLV
jgi:ribosomal-protein-alanine N-acetyltransferase